MHELINITYYIIRELSYCLKYDNSECLQIFKFREHILAEELITFFQGFIQSAPLIIFGRCSVSSLLTVEREQKHLFKRFHILLENFDFIIVVTKKYQLFRHGSERFFYKSNFPALTSDLFLSQKSAGNFYSSKIRADSSRFDILFL